MPRESISAQKIGGHDTTVKSNLDEVHYDNLSFKLDWGTIATNLKADLMKLTW